MAITPSSLVFHCLLFFSLLLFQSCCSNKTYAYGGRGTTTSQYHALETRSLLTATVCSDSFTKGPRRSSMMLQIAHKDGPCAPNIGRRDGKTTTAPNPIQILLKDQIRVRYLHSKLSRQVEDMEEQAIPAVSSSVSYESGDFIVKIGFGTPKEDLSVLFDTGSDLTWIQCLPCAGSCYSQQNPIFNPSKSLSYSNISCNSLECSQLKASTGTDLDCTSTCLYAVQYGDKSYSIGFFAHETLTLTSSYAFPNFQFGCGQQNQGLFGKTAGLLGLGRGKVSFVSQTSQNFGRVFSYCLPATASSTGYLAFGITGKVGIKYTPLLTDPRGPSFYFLNLLGISVAGQKLSISPSVFSSSGTIIDSGTVITRLPQAAYAALKSAFRQSMSQYPSAEPDSLLDTCYDLSGYEKITIPNIALHFEGGVDVDLDQSGILFAPSTSQVCLGFAGNSDVPGTLTILGNKQQRALEVVYDVAGGRIGFGSKACS